MESKYLLTVAIALTFLWMVNIATEPLASSTALMPRSAPVTLFAYVEQTYDKVTNSKEDWKWSMAWVNSGRIHYASPNNNSDVSEIVFVKSSIVAARAFFITATLALTAVLVACFVNKCKTTSVPYYAFFVWWFLVYLADINAKAAALSPEAFSFEESILSLHVIALLTGVHAFFHKDGDNTAVAYADGYNLN